MAFVDFGEPLDISTLNIEGFVDYLSSKNITFQDGKIKGLHPAQSEIVKSAARFKTIACGRRFGKSQICRIVGGAVVLQPGRKVWVVAPTYKLADIVFESLYHLFVNELKLCNPNKGGRASRSDRIIQLSNGSIIEAKSCERRDQLVGSAVDLIIFDEAGLVPNLQDIFNQELSATLIDRQGSCLFISTPRGRNGFYDFYLLGLKGKEARRKLEAGVALTDSELITLDWDSFKFSSYANTKEEGGYLERKEIDKYRLLLPSVKFRQEYLADFTAIGDVAFPEFDKQLQVVNWEISPHLPVHCGMDFNYQTPCTTLYLQYDEANDSVFIFDEFHPKNGQVSPHQQAIQLLEMDKNLGHRVEIIAADIAGKQKGRDGVTAWDDLADYNIYPVGKKMRLEVGCNLIRLYCAFPRLDENKNVIYKETGEPEVYPKLFIHERCVNTINALESAATPKAKDGVFKEGYKDDGVVDGPLDALRYILVYILNPDDTLNIYKVN